MPIDINANIKVIRNSVKKGMRTDSWTKQEDRRT